MFVNPNINDIKIARELNTDCIEIHTGHLSNLIKHKKKYSKELKRILRCSILAKNYGIEVHAGHGLDYKTTRILNKIKEIEEFNIGHFIIGESVIFGLKKVVQNFKKILKN